MNIGNYVLRNAVAADTEKVLHFYGANRNGNNAVREDSQLVEAIEDKKLLLVVGRHNNIEAVSGTFRYLEGQRGARRNFRHLFVAGIPTSAGHPVEPLAHGRNPRSRFYSVFCRG